MYIVTFYSHNRCDYLFIIHSYWVSEDNSKTREEIIDGFTNSNFLNKRSFICRKCNYLDFYIGRDRYRVTIREGDFDHYNDLKRRRKPSDMFWRDW